MASGMHIDMKFLRQVEDTLALKVCVWKLTALMSKKKQVFTHVTSPRSQRALFDLATKLPYTVTLEKLKTIPAVQDRWKEIYSAMPVSYSIVHVVWKYIFSQKGLTSIQRELRDESFGYGLNALSKTFPDECANLDNETMEKIIKHLMKDDIQEIQLSLCDQETKSVDYELEIAEKNSEINSLKRRLSNAKDAVVEQNEAFKEIMKKLSKIHIDETTQQRSKSSIGLETWEAALTEVDEHIAIIHDLQKKYKGEKDKCQQLKRTVEDLEETKARCEAEIDYYAERSAGLQNALDDYKSELKNIVGEFKKQSETTNALLEENKVLNAKTNKHLSELKTYKERESPKDRKRRPGFEVEGKGMKSRFPDVL